MKLQNILASAAIAMSFGVPAYADDVFSGQTGQYHVIPNQQDVQRITLVGIPDKSCPEPNGALLFAIDEWGQVESVPFAVPSKTVFLLTDAEFKGRTIQSGLTDVGTPALFVRQANFASSFDRAWFPANRPILGQQNEPISGNGAIASGVAFPTGSQLCTTLASRPGQFKFQDPAMFEFHLDAVFVHGTVVDNTRTNAYPYFTW